MNIVITIFYGFLVGILLRDCKNRFGNEVFWIMLGIFLTLLGGALIIYA